MTHPYAPLIAIAVWSLVFLLAWLAGGRSR